MSNDKEMREDYDKAIKVIARHMTDHPQDHQYFRDIYWHVWQAAFNPREQMGEGALKQIERALLAVDGWKDGQTFYRATIEEIRDILTAQGENQ